MNKFLLLISLSLASLSATNINVNSPISVLDSYAYETPNKRAMKVPAKTKLVILAFEKDTGATINEFLNTKEKYYLQKNKAIFIADIHAMPSMITKMFALPKMRKYKHLIYLHYGEVFQTKVPNKDDMITLLEIQNQKITSVRYVSSAKEIQTAIEK